MKTTDSRWRDRLFHRFMSKRQVLRVNAKNIAWLDRNVFMTAYTAHGSDACIPARSLRWETRLQQG